MIYTYTGFTRCIYDYWHLHTHNTEPDLVSVQFFLTQIKTDD
jgi:hypothetical protein